MPGAHDTDDHLQYTWRMFSMGDLSRLELLNPAGKGRIFKGFFEKPPQRWGPSHYPGDTGYPGIRPGAGEEYGPLFRLQGLR